jgi:hypothetical protein
MRNMSGYTPIDVQTDQHVTTATIDRPQRLNAFHETMGEEFAFPVHHLAMRLEGLRLDAGAADRLAASLWSDLRGSLDG